MSATPKGHGSWAAEVASNQVYDATLEAGQVDPTLTMHSGSVWRGAGRESLPTNYVEGIAHDTLVRLDPARAQSLDFLGEVSAGTVHTGHEEWKIESTTALDHPVYDYWRDIGEVFGLSPTDDPGFDQVYGKWAYVWGIPSGIERAISLANGEEVETPITSEGAYLVKIAFPDEFVVEGTFAAKGTPASESRSTLPPRHPRPGHPDGVSRRSIRRGKRYRPPSRHRAHGEGPDGAGGDGDRPNPGDPHTRWGWGAAPRADDVAPLPVVTTVVTSL